MTIERATRHSRNAALLAAGSAAFTLGVCIPGLLARPVLGIGPSALIDIALVALLAAGVYRRSRICALCLLAYFVTTKTFMLVEGAIHPWALPIGAALAYFYVQGVRGAFQYHRLVGTPSVSPRTLAKRAAGLLLLAVGILVTMGICLTLVEDHSDSPLSPLLLAWFCLGLLPSVGGAFLVWAGWRVRHARN